MLSTEAGAPRWQALRAHDGTTVGTVARPRRIRVERRLAELLHTAVDLVLGPTSEHARQPDLTVQDVCPDPLVHALSAGLSRPRALDRQIDGGSSWTQLVAIEEEELVSVSSVASIDERLTSGGARLVRTTYLTELLRPGTGQALGRCTGTSLDLEVR